MFQRSAHNFSKKGFYPTDEKTMEAISASLLRKQTDKIRLLDPCCGNGDAVVDLANSLGSNAEVYGIEIDEERAYNAKDRLCKVLHGDLQNVSIQTKSFGCLFLNPPYGPLMRDQQQTSGLGRSEITRLEELFLKLTIPSLQIGGVMVLIVPKSSLTQTLNSMLYSNFKELEFYRASVSTYNQVVIFGKRCKRRTPPKGSELPNDIEQLPLIDEKSDNTEYLIPPSRSVITKFFLFQIDARQLSEEIDRNPCVWDDIAMSTQRLTQPPRRPLTQLSDWHLSLALASGVHEGVIKSAAGRVLLVKGDTYKRIITTRDEQLNENDEYVTITTDTETFCPMIKAVDLTVSSENFGAVLEIR